MSLMVSSDDPYYISSALTATSNQFFGGAPPSTPTSFVDIDGDTLSPTGSTPFEAKYSHRIGVSGTVTIPLRGAIQAVGRITISSGQSRFYLPNGVGILVDPINIGFDHQSLRAELGLSFALSETRFGTTRLEGGAGGVVSRISTKVTSALLNVQNNSFSGDGYLFAGIEFQPPANWFTSTIILKTRVRVYRASGFTIQSGIQFDF
ncbi:MAG: hypothetical protein GXP03_00630 [Alphaproteobacteria bacterium]|nr:hypothetical protein [Alphaproteobacteria bacterium]